MGARWAVTGALAVAAGVALGGCGIDKAGERVRQRNTIGAVEIATTFCTSGDADLAAHACAPFSSQHRGQALVSYRVPEGSSAPDGFDDDGGLLHFRPDAALAAYMRATYPEAGMRWVAYVSSVQSPVPGIGHAFVASPEFSLPAGAARPYAGPFPYKVVGGWRELPGAADDGSAPVDCSSTGDTSCVETGAGGDDSLARLRDLAVLPGGVEAPTVLAGGHVRVPFEVRFAGAGGDGVRFGLSASTDLAGASVALDADSVAPGDDSVNPVAAEVSVPAGAAAGTYRVDLDAVAPGDGDVIIRRVRAKGGAVGALEHRTGSMTFRVVDPPLPPPPHDPDPGPGPPDEPPPPALPPVAVPPAVVPPALPGVVSGPPQPRPPAPRRARLRLSLAAVPRRAYVGDYASYLVMVSNMARQPAARTRVCERLPARVQFVHATRRMRFAGRSLCFAGGRLGAGRSLAARVYVHVDTDARPGMARARATATAANADRVRARARLRVLRRAAPPRRAPVTG